MSKPISQLLITAKYKSVEHTKQDVLNVTRYFKSLTPKLERYTFPNGQTKELICLDGTIPVTFRNAKYNIPIGIYISDNHPIEAPICYVRPTKNMTIKTSRHVDGSGRVYLPYLSEWNRNTSDILSSIQVMQVIFGQMCPVYQRTKDPDPDPKPYWPDWSSAPVTHFPTYPFKPIPPGYPDSVQSGSRESAPISPTSMPTPPAPVYPFSSQPQPYSAPDTSGTIKEEHIRASLLSAVEDRLKFRLKEKVHQLQDEIESLKKTSNDLNLGKIKLDEMKTKMAKEVDELTEAKRKLQDLDDQLQEFIIKYDKEGEEINPDEVYGPTKPLYKQLLEAVAEEQAVVDAIYYTGEGQRKGVITLEVFLKSVRELSRRQFMLRALMRACRTKAQFPN